MPRGIRKGGGRRRLPVKQPNKLIDQYITVRASDGRIVQAWEADLEVAQC